MQGRPLPVGTEYLFGWFCDQSRGNNGFGPLALTAIEILAWSQLSGHRLNPWEYSVIRALDSAWLKVYAEMNRQEEPQK